MNDAIFDPDRLDEYRLSIDYVARSFEASQSLGGLQRHARDEWLRAALSIPLNIAVAIDYEHEHRDAEHEHEREPEPSCAPEDGLRGFTNG